nr:response regulator [Feifania hominis]
MIEDEKTIADIVEFNLRREGFSTVTAYDGAEGLERARKGRFSLILLDVMLPGLDGWEVLKALRRDGDTTPILMLTAREEEIDKIRGLELGADDYITKPFSMKELLARIRANIRRVAYESLERSEQTTEVTARELTINLERVEARKNGTLVELSNREFSLLSFFATHPGKVFSREELLSNVWGYEGYLGDLRAVDVMIRRLREKIEEDPAEPQFIMTKRGAGYYFEM